MFLRLALVQPSDQVALLKSVLNRSDEVELVDANRGLEVGYYANQDHTELISG